MVGDVVNLSARLMVQAKAGILVDQSTFDRCKDSSEITFIRLPPVRVKGKANPVPIFEPQSKESFIRQSGHFLVGRGDEIDKLQKLVYTIQGSYESKTTVVFMEGDAGVGKTR